jgi:hypothetical protein
MASFGRLLYLALASIGPLTGSKTNRSLLLRHVPQIFTLLSYAPAIATSGSCRPSFKSEQMPAEGPMTRNTPMAAFEQNSLMLRVSIECI